MSNLDQLLYLHTLIIVDEVTVKTRSGGLPWKQAAPNQYTVTVCEPPTCLDPFNYNENPATGDSDDGASSPTGFGPAFKRWAMALGADIQQGLSAYNTGATWTINITRLTLAAGADGEDVYTIDILANGTPFASLDSRDVNNIDALFTQVERTVNTTANYQRVIEFLNAYPNAPSTPVTNFVMCGGVYWGGSGKVTAIYNPKITPAGVEAGGSDTIYYLDLNPKTGQGGAKDVAAGATVFSIYQEKTTGGATMGGSASLG